MKGKIILSLLFSLAIVSFTFAQVPASQDTIFIDGGTFANGGNEGLLEATINGDVDNNNNRINPNRVYALYQGQVYWQLASIDVNNPNGTLTIVGVPDPNNPSAKTKPIIVVTETDGNAVQVNGNSTNLVYGSLKLENIYYQAQQIGGAMNNELFMLGTGNQKGQRLVVNNCIFEFGNIDLFDATDESGGVGGWPYGASFYFTNTYFRNLFYNSQWWDSRVYQCKHPTDTLWVENCTVQGGGLTFLQQNQLTEVTYINHNTIFNQKKYWLLAPYKKEYYVTNNIFVNQNWVGEDINVTNSGQDPDGQFMGTINIDTLNSTNGLIVSPKFMVNGDTNNISPELNLDKLKIFVSNNINYYSPELVSGYYQNPTYILSDVGTIPSYLTWSTPEGPKKIENIPGLWMNDRTKALFNAYNNFIEERTLEVDPQMGVSSHLDAATVTAMAEWNQKQWGDPRFAEISSNILTTSYIVGDYDPKTLPGINNGVKGEQAGEGAGIQLGIAKFTDFAENFGQTTSVSTIDQLPIGSLQWNDAQLAAYNSAAAAKAVADRYAALVVSVESKPGIANTFSLNQNYPNPFNPTTNIEFSIPQSGNVTLKVFNILGQEVATLLNGYKNAGKYTASFDASSLPSGLYVYQLTSGSFTSSKKMMLLK